MKETLFPLKKIRFLKNTRSLLSFPSLSVKLFPRYFPSKEKKPFTFHEYRVLQRLHYIYIVASAGGGFLMCPTRQST